MKRVLLSWSSGKDSAWALHLLRKTDAEIAGLLTTFNAAADRVAMHAVRHSLVEAQAASAGVPLWPVPLPSPCSNQQYEEMMAQTTRDAVARGIDAVAFGDLYLRDIREYRERMLAGTSLEPLFPLWDIPTDLLAREMIACGLKARITCIDKKVLDPRFSGREYDTAFLAELPGSVDPCGENGEFHSFAYAGPMFSKPVPVATGETRDTDGFVFTDLVAL